MLQLITGNLKEKGRMSEGDMWTHRDRILALVNHEEPDRIGIGYSAAPEALDWHVCLWIK